MIVRIVGGHGGVLQLDPSAVFAFNRAFGQPSVHITNIQLSNNPNVGDTPDPLTSSDLPSGSIELLHDQNDLYQIVIIDLY